MTTITERVEALTAEGVTPSKIRAYLTIEDYAPKDIASALKEAGLVGKRATFRSLYWDFLVDSAPTVAEAEAYIDDWVLANPETNSNIIRHRKVFVNEAVLVNRIREALESESQVEEAA